MRRSDLCCSDKRTSVARPNLVALRRYDGRTCAHDCVYCTRPACAGNAGVGLNTDLADSEQLTKYASASSYNATTNCTNPLASTGGTLVYVASGGRMCVTPDNKETGKYCPDTQPAWSARREAAHGFVTIDFVSATSATLK